MKHIFSFSKTKEKKELSSAKRLFIGSSLIILSLFLFISFVSYFFTGEIDQSNLADFTDISISNSNSLGKIGAIISDFFIYRGFGVSSIIFSFLIFISALKILLDLKKRNITKNWLWGFYLIFLFSIFFGFVDNGNIYSGIIGYEIVNFLDIYISYLGISFLLIFMSLVYLTFRLKFGVNDILKILKYFQNINFKTSKNTDLTNEFSEENFTEEIVDEIDEVEINQEIEEELSEEETIKEPPDVKEDGATDKIGIEGSSSYVRVSQLKKQAVDKLIENVDHSQVLDYL